MSPEPTREAVICVSLGRHDRVPTRSAFLAFEGRFWNIVWFDIDHDADIAEYDAASEGHFLADMEEATSAAEYTVEIAPQKFEVRPDIENADALVELVAQGLEDDHPGCDALLLAISADPERAI